MKPNRTPLSLKSMNSFGVEAVAAGCVEFADVESLRAFLRSNAPLVSRGTCSAEVIMCCLHVIIQV